MRDFFFGRLSAALLGFFGLFAAFLGFFRFFLFSHLYIFIIFSANGESNKHRPRYVHWFYKLRRA